MATCSLTPFNNKDVFQVNAHIKCILYMGAVLPAKGFEFNVHPVLALPHSIAWWNTPLTVKEYSGDSPPTQPADWKEKYQHDMDGFALSSYMYVFLNTFACSSSHRIPVDTLHSPSMSPAYLLDKKKIYVFYKLKTGI